MSQHLRYAFRQLRKTPGFTIVCVLTLALGIGANTAVFSVMNAVLLRSLPVADPSRVVYLNTTGAPHRGNNTGDWTTSFSYPVYDALRQQHGLSQVMAYVPLAIGKVAVRYTAAPEEAAGEMVSGNFFSGLGVRIARGHGFTASDESQHAPVMVISYNYWTQRFSRNSDVLGKTLYVKGVPFTIMGIAAQGFEGTEPGASIDFWIPLQSRKELNAWGMSADDGKTYLNRPEWWCLRMIGRLAPSISKQQAIAQLQPVFQSAAYIGIGSPEAGEKPPVLSFQDAKSFPGMDDYYGKPLKVLMSMVSLVLLIAISNVVMLLLARNATRQREFSLRLALGAGRSELFHQLLAESALLVALGGALAWLFAVTATKALAAWSQIETTLAPDLTVLLFTLGILIAVALIFGLAPLRTVFATGPGLVLKTSAATSNTDEGRARTGRIIVTIQMALCLTLLVGGGLLIRTLRNLQNTPLGMRTEGLVVFGINPQNVHSYAESVAFYQNLTNKLRVLPGVESVTLMENRLGSWWSNNNSGYLIDGKKPPNADGEKGLVRNNVVGPDFFHTLGVPVLAGRDFTDADTASAPKAIIINELFAQRFLPGENPIGHHVGDKNRLDIIIGVVKNHKYTSINEDPIPMMWTPYTQQDSVGEMHFEMRVHGEPTAILPMVRKAVQQIDPNLPLMKPIAQRAQFEESISTQLLFARLAGFFGLLAVVLVATGLYGTMAYRVNNRTVEIGVRMAVGARRGQVIWMVLKDSLILTAIGVIIGVPLAALTAKALTSALYGVKPYDFLSYAAAVLGVLLVSLAASAMPAQRAARVDPLKALRTE